MTLDNFLTSGYRFSEEDFRLKSRFILVNISFSIIFLMIFFLMILLFMRGEVEFAYSNLIYLLFTLILLYLLRVKKTFYKFIVPILPVASIVLVSIALISYPSEQIRFSWFFVIVIFSFFLGGKKLGLIMSSSSVLTILLIEYFVDTSLNTYTLTLAIIILLLGTLVIYFYEEREVSLREKLHDSNLMLEERIRIESKKRIKAYQESNLELEESAKKLQEQKEAYKQLAHYDTLTNLPNRIFFLDRLEHSIDKAKRNTTKLAVLFFDLDNFKEINDSLGHTIGDEVLKIVAKRLSSSVRKSDTIARLGGDEFTLIMEDLSDVYKIGEISQSIIDSINKPMYVQDNELYVSVSIGASFYPNDGLDSKSLIRCADSAMYSAKQSGKNIFHFYKPEMTEKAIERVTLETSIRKGIDRDEFVVYYQPIIDVYKNEIVGLEALIRWEHPELGLLVPDKFIHVAESSSLIVELGNIVLDKVSDQLIAWHEEAIEPQSISVNLSVKQLRQDDLVSTIEKTLKKIHFRNNWLQLEITEGYAMHQLDHAVMVLQEIKDLGVTIAIDDFGTGYSSLSYIKRLPVDSLKIDKSFIRDIPRDEDDEALVRAIVAMAKSLHLRVIAEGIEKVEQEKFLIDIGCHVMQGYRYGEPMKASKINI